VADATGVPDATGSPIAGFEARRLEERLEAGEAVAAEGRREGRGESSSLPWHQQEAQHMHTTHAKNIQDTIPTPTPTPTQMMTHLSHGNGPQIVSSFLSHQQPGAAGGEGG
jgi:hypothetical protein